MKEEGKEGIPSIRRLGPRISHSTGTEDAKNRKMMEVEFSTSSGCFGASERRREKSTTGGVEEKEEIGLGRPFAPPRSSALSSDPSLLSG